MSAREIEKMKKLTSFLSVSRADDYNQWWTVGITLFNIGTGRDCEDEALEAWINVFFSKVQSMMKDTM